MKTIPMIFNSDMVKALVNGRKTVTRRPAKGVIYSDRMGFVFNGYAHGIGSDHRETMNNIIKRPVKAGCPANIGDLIYVRETWADAGANAPELTLYKANYPEHVPAHYENVPSISEIKWTPSIHMPRWASRLTLTVTDVRIETMKELRQDPEQVIREGFGSFPQFRHTWREIYGQCEPDDLVWVIEFEVIHQNIDTYLKQVK
ncbi:TPA: ASCH domain-containing protein [Vibrio parahaemolyticus]|nr:ASCH domain-containing protein [Vibrio parahaemolyticus]